ncbi:hypothetical protein NG799_29400 [Laspinema sp. D1]|uniref:ATP-binding protein n=1 Tax=Laspinema palackyanum D2a TaxID=2953684 RepID=A0ABT2N469_9CYAN|nr:hypothetical protein [Laspinema sp. D2a]
MPKKKYKKPKDVSNEPIQLSLFDLLLDNLPDSDSLSEPANCYEDAELSQPDSLLESSDASQSKEDNSRGESFSAIPERLFVPDRFESLENRAKHQLENFIVPVETALAHLDETYSDMRSAGRGAFWVFRGNSGSGKSTFLHTVNLFRPQVKTISIRAEQSVPDTLRELRNSDRSLNELRILVLEGREALTDFSEEELEKNLHAINSFIRSDYGRDTLIVWPCNSDPLEEKLIDLAARLGAESLLGVGDRSYRFQGSPQNQYSGSRTHEVQYIGELTHLNHPNLS